MLIAQGSQGKYIAEAVEGSFEKKNFSNVKYQFNKEFKSKMASLGKKTDKLSNI